MKIKILIMPLVIVIVVTISIWLVYPAYSNGIDGVKENYIKLKEKQTKLTQLRNKSENVNSLSAQISSLPEKDILYSFIPTEIKEEEIINGLANLSTNSGLLLLDSTVNQPAKEISNEDNLAIQDSGTAKEGKGGNISLAPKIKKLKTQIKIVGSYEKIKDFLSSIGKFNRSNEFEILEINRNNAGSQTSTDPNILLVNATIDFNFLKSIKLDNSNVSNPIFSNSKLQVRVIEDIKNNKNSNSFQLNVDQKGKGNIFQP